jgi:hypothetical protein
MKNDACKQLVSHRLNRLIKFAQLDDSSWAGLTYEPYSNLTIIVTRHINAKFLT